MNFVGFVLGTGKSMDKRQVATIIAINMMNLRNRETKILLVKRPKLQRLKTS
jgi:hypothetical protein